MMSWPVVEPVDKKEHSHFYWGGNPHFINIGLSQCVWRQEEVRVLRHFLNDRLNTQLPIRGRPIIGLADYRRRY